MNAYPRLRDCGNHLLDRLPADEFASLSPMLRRTSVDFKDIVHEYEADVEYVYFPTTALIALLTVLEDDDPVETIPLGHEGMLGVAAALGIDESPSRAVCRMGGETLRIRLSDFRSAMDRGTTLSRLVQLYIAYSIRLTSQGIACLSTHLDEARACRWLLMLHDQVPGDDFAVTQSLLADMVGIRRQGVTEIAGRLQRAGIISHRRGRITVLDRPMLESAACECYSATRTFYDRMMGSRPRRVADATGGPTGSQKIAESVRQGTDIPRSIS